MRHVRIQYSFLLKFLVTSLTLPLAQGVALLLKGCVLIKAASTVFCSVQPSCLLLGTFSGVRGEKCLCTITDLSWYNLFLV